VAPDWLDAFLITGLFQVVMVIGLALLLHLQLGLARIANFGVVGFWGLGMYAFGVLYVQVDWPFGEPLQFLVCAVAASLVTGVAGLLVGWLIADMDTDGVLVGTLGFATAVQILATTQDDLTGGARGLGGLGLGCGLG
jgi:ABC-type branched-subunit amino acid transport system permease subunit